VNEWSMAKKLPLAVAILLVVACRANSGAAGANRQALPERFESPPSSPTLTYTTRFWVDPDEECKGWSAALQIAKKMAGCDDDYRPDLSHKCQVAVRRCSPGCNICENLRPDSGALATFGERRQPPPPDVNYAGSRRGLITGDWDTEFDPRFACNGDLTLLAQVMVHEAVHACKGSAGGSMYVNDRIPPMPSTPAIAGCVAEEIAPFGGAENCGDS
jgi:hypothetical protein